MVSNEYSLLGPFPIKKVGMHEGQQQQEETSLHFLCRITQLPPTTTDTQSDQVRISFTLAKGKMVTLLFLHVMFLTLYSFA